jgi:hypothetical protein
MAHVTETEARNAADHRKAKAAAVTSVAATKTFTTTAAFLADLERGDEITFDTLTGGSSLVAGTVYYVARIVLSAGAPTGAFFISATPNGVEISGTTNVTAGNVNSGRASTTGNRVGGVAAGYAYEE